MRFWKLKSGAVFVWGREQIYFRKALLNIFKQTKKHFDFNVGKAKRSGRTIYISSICNNDVIFCFNQNTNVSDAWDIFIGFVF